MSEIKFVKQEHKSGCACACIAMVTGRTYAEIDKDFHNDFDEGGIDLVKTMDYLSDWGFRIIKKEIEYYLGDVKFGRDELLKPFAPVHLLRVKSKFDSTSGHLVVMDADGKLFCPSESKEEDIRNSYVITTVLGLYR